MTIRTGGDNSGEMGGWGARIVLDGGHLISVQFSGLATDDKVGITLFDFEQTKGGWNGNHTQSTISCTGTEVGTLGDFVGPGEVLPPGTSASDQVTSTINVVAVPKD